MSCPCVTASLSEAGLLFATCAYNKIGNLFAFAFALFWDTLGVTPLSP